MRHIVGTSPSASGSPTLGIPPGRIEGRLLGLDPTRARRAYRTCDALLNIVGATELRDEHARAVPRLRRDRPGHGRACAGARRRAHPRGVRQRTTAIVTYGENYGAPDCGVPAGRHRATEDAPADRPRPVADGVRPAGARLHDDRQLPAGRARRRSRTARPTAGASTTSG